LHLQLPKTQGYKTFILDLWKQGLQTLLVHAIFVSLGVFVSLQQYLHRVPKYFCHEPDNITRSPYYWTNRGHYRSPVTSFGYENMRDEFRPLHSNYPIRSPFIGSTRRLSLVQTPQLLGVLVFCDWNAIVLAQLAKLGVEYNCSFEILHNTYSV
jgi:hypothetical protein